MYRFELSPSPNPPPLGELFAVDVLVSDVASGRPVTGGALSLDATMPEHGHGMQTSPRSSESPRGGSYHAVGFKFHMYGRWVFAIAFEAGGRADRCSIEFPFDPPRATPGG